MNPRKRQTGLTTVEFAIIAALALLTLFSVIEVGRAVFVLNALGETTRRTARMATVCPIDDPAIWEVGLFNGPGGGTGSSVVGELVPQNIAVEYLDRNGNALTDPTGSFSQIYFVRARIVNFQHRMLIPFVDYIFPTPDFSTTLRRESLGVPREGSIVPC
jgi:hypothetical protein